ncbi:MAG TPA: hypothetical protein VFV35_01570 [Acidimicrobiales bacterium]|nr:hypothetical protein [Acidimicrobiales bacterium]
MAARDELELHPELPAAPQLPRRAHVESMLAQVAAGMSGIAIGEDGRLATTGAVLGAPEDGAPLDPEAWRGTLALLTAAAGRSGPLKLQITGPVTLGLALVDAGVAARRAFTLAATTVARGVRSLLDAARASSPGAPAVVVLDEPSLSRAMHPGVPLAPEETVDAVSGALAAASAAGAALNGVHCCGAADWTLVLHAGPDLVSTPATLELAVDAAAFGAFLERGGWVAWGVVPTHGPFGDRHQSHWARLNDVWKLLASGGADPVRLRTQSLLTPDCGLAHHDQSQVPVIMGLVRRVAERVQDQAYAARMSVGA